MADKGLKAAQILLTLGDTEQRRRYLNARRTLQALLDMGTVPVINENDTVATQELRYGDNDRLAARVAGMMSADCLILLSDVDGFYTAAPETDENADLIREVTDVSDDLLAMAGGAGSAVGSGGMVTKLQAAQIAMQAGCHMILTDGAGRTRFRACTRRAARRCFAPPKTRWRHAKTGLPEPCKPPANCILMPVLLPRCATANRFCRSV